MSAPDEQHQRLERATAHLDPPFAVVDLDAFDRNAQDLARRATGVPIRVASKSVRVRDLVDRAVAAQGFSGVMTFALREAIWLARQGHRDVLMGYPTVGRAALRELADDDELRASIVLMVDHPAQLALVRAAGATADRPVRVCLDIDAPCGSAPCTSAYAARRCTGRTRPQTPPPPSGARRVSSWSG
jgi:D-serine deaminase-like pyridoxal phosphate-dependent protein